MVIRTRIFLENDDNTETAIILDEPRAAEMTFEGEYIELRLTIPTAHMAILPWRPR
jgi:hypothetical protein